MPDFSLEATLPGNTAGMDEAGRGPWAGPVVAAIVLLNRRETPAGIDDSKKLSAAQREQLFERILRDAHAATGMASVEEIDALNILAATKLAMQRAYEALSGKLRADLDCVLVDGNQPPVLPCRTIPVIGGDGLSTSIAAASIIAKVTRDRIMRRLASEFPGYGWETNAGYGTALHQRGIAQSGLTPHHRRSLAPIRKALEAREQA